MLKIVQATSINTKGKMDIMTTGMKSIINQILPGNTDEDDEDGKEDMSFLDGWLNGDDSEVNEPQPQPKETRWVKNKLKRKKKSKHGR